MIYDVLIRMIVALIVILGTAVLALDAYIIFDSIKGAL